MAERKLRRDAMTPWRCANGHVLGQVQRNGRGITQLWLYRNAVDTALNLPLAQEGRGGMAEVDVMAVVEGLVMDVVCSVCGEVRTWVPGEEAIRRLVERVQEEGE